MENKLINFHIYRYHLLPLDSKSKQIELFENKSLSYEEIKAKKNEFFGKTLDNLIKSKNNNYPLKLE